MRSLHNVIGGTTRTATTSETIPVVDPATGRTVAEQPASSATEVDAAVTAARLAQPGWAALPLTERLRQLRSCAAALTDQVEVLATAEVDEMGKPLTVSRDFVGGGIATFEHSLADAEAYPFLEEQPIPEGQSLLIRQPLGVVGLVLPWNFTVVSALIALGPLLASGNTVVLKPSEKAPISAAVLMEHLDLPPGVVNLVLGDGRAGQALSSHAGIDLIHFTGSVPTGLQVARDSALQLRRSVLELGGKDPVIVDSGVDVAAVADEIAAGCFLNSGQICTSMERIYAHRDIAAELIEALVERAEAHRVGPGAQPETTLGPLVDDRQRQIVHGHVTDAVERGAHVHTGGRLPEGAGTFYPPTVLSGVDADMLVMTEETFGPLAPVQTVDSFDEALELARGTAFGLAATVYSDDPAHIEAAHTLPAGIVWINQWQGGGLAEIYEPARASGMGATGGRASFDAATRPVSVVRSASSPRFPSPRA